MSTGKWISLAGGLLMTATMAISPAFAADTKAGAAGQERGMSHKGSDFATMSLKNDQGEDLGMVKDILIGPDGNLSYVLVSAAGKPGDVLTPIPYTKGMWKFEPNAATVKNLDKAELEKAPTVSAAEWKKLDTPEFGSTVHGYYREATK